MSIKIDILYCIPITDGFDRKFIVYYVTTNNINFYRTVYPVDEDLMNKLNSELFEINDYLKRNIRIQDSKKVEFEDLGIYKNTWSEPSTIKALEYKKQRDRDIKINQIL